jgi:D-arginine dehydrogenase
MRTDFLVVGGGIAGASAGYFLSRNGRVLLVEGEPAAGYHATGRSAALFSEYYGSGAVRALTAASRGFLTTPPVGFTEYPLVTARGVLALAGPGAEERFTRAYADGLDAPVPVRELAPDEVQRICPVVRPGWYRRAMLKPGAMDLDVDALLQGFLRGIRAAGGTVLTRARVTGVEYRAGAWQVTTTAGQFHAPVLVNAAGAWADELARLAGVAPVGLTSLRRTACVVDAPRGLDVSGWPMVADVAETFYLKPESGGLLLSPADATPVPPHDVRPDDLDVAIAAARVEEATTLQVRRIRRAWAGLRCVTTDGDPVIGAAPDAPGFFWLAGSGGTGVQTAPAAGRLVAALAAGLADHGLDGALVARVAVRSGAFVATS